MLILAFDTAGAGCSACVWQDGVVLSRRAGRMERGQAEALVPLLQDVLAEAGIAWSALDRLAVTVGPGSFTGLRVGLATARAASLASGLPVVGVTTLEVFAHGLSPDVRPSIGTVLAVADARRHDVYAQAFAAEDLRPLTDAASVVPDDVPGWLAAAGAVGPVVVVGDGVPLLATVAAAEGWVIEGDGQIVPDPVVIAALAAGRAVLAEPPAALYIRPADALVPVNGGQLRP